jgi:hypothetical protein
MIRGVNIDWFDVDGTVYGLNSERGITDRYGWEVEMIDANIAAAILTAKAKHDKK